MKVHMQCESNPENIDNPIILILPGSSPGYLPSEVVLGLVENGYDVFSLAYFGIGSLPDRLEEIPLEYFHLAVSEIRSLINSPNRKIVLLGISKGAEGALLYASRFKDIDGLILYAPGSWVLPNHVDRRMDKEIKSSWMCNGRPVPFLPLEKFDEPAGRVEYRSYFRKALLDTTFSNSFIIEAEHIPCPILMMSGSDDNVWPSADMSEIIEKRVLRSNQNARIERLVFPNAGHQFFWFGIHEPRILSRSQTLRLTGIKKHRFTFGGTDEGNLSAMKSSQIKVLSFLQMLD